MVLSRHHKNLKQRTLRPSDRPCLSSRADQCYSSVLQLSFIQKIKENTSSRHEGMPTQKTRREERVRERERQSTHTHTCRRELPAPSPLAPLFLCFFLPDLPCVNWASQECPLFCRRSSLWSSDIPLFYFHGLFPSLSFSHCHSGFLFSILTT